MNKTTFLLFTLLLLGLTSIAQTLDCADFKIGAFYIPNSDEMKKYTITSNDSIIELIIDRDLSINRYVIVREEDKQTEWENGIENGSPVYDVIEWIDDCTYRLTYDSSKMELDEGKKWVNANNGIVISKVKIENKCMFYIATMTTNEGEKITQDGVICIE